MRYTPCNFDRNEYLAHTEIFESIKIRDVCQELSEFNSDPQDLAFELAYTRYRVAKLEVQLAEALKQVPKIMKRYPDDGKPDAAGWYWVAYRGYKPVEPEYYSGFDWFESDCEGFKLSDPQFWLEMDPPTIPDGEA